MEKKRKHHCSEWLLLRAGLLFFQFLFLHSYLSAQEFGGNPPSVKWRQINTDTARVIFPSGLERQAQDIANTVHDLARLQPFSLGAKTRKINIVLQNQPTLSNGYVALGPYRSEFYLTPRQNNFELGSLPWHQMLALHEYRHVHQYNNFRRGLSKAFYYVFGQEGQALANSLTVPDWFFEGDAVYQETAVSTQGRGRLPYFFNGYRSLWASGKNYSWMKLRNGSYRDFVPDHYQLGYLLVSYGYDKYGEQSWKKITGDAADFKGLFYPFQRAFKSTTGQHFKDFTKDALDDYRKSIHENNNDSAANFARQNKHFNTDEQHPQLTNDGHIIYLKSSYRQIPAFVMRDMKTGQEKKIRNRSLSVDNYFSYSNGQIVYSSYRPHPRWGWKNYELITVLDIYSGKEKVITKNTRYQSPDISGDGKMIVAVHTDPSGKNEIHVLDAATGNIINVIQNPSGYIFTYPKFYDKKSFVAAVRNSTGEMALGKFDISSGAHAWLTPFSLQVIGFPQVKNDTVFFSMSDGNQDKLFAAAKQRVLRFEPDVTNYNTGNYQLTGHNGVYAWTAFTAAGYHLFHGKGTFSDYTFAAQTSGEPKVALNILKDTSLASRRIEKYPSAFGLLNFHSWRPYFSDPEYSYSLISENILNTLQSEIYFTYNRNEKFKETGAMLAYGGWYPVINGGASFTFDRLFIDSARSINWNEFNARAGASVPLSFVSGSFSQSITTSASFNTKQVFYTGASKSQFDNKRFNYGDFILSISNSQARARQHIFPKIAQTFYARYRSIINRYEANQLLLSAGIYLPGFFRNHSIVLQASYQRRDTLQQYNFSNGFPFSRGYPDIDFPRMYKLGINYHFPIAYPDAGIANIVYLSRLRSNIFYDYSEVKSLRSGLKFPFKTVGTELYFDTRWWNQLPVSFGIRYSRLLDAALAGVNANQWEIVLPVNLLTR